MVKEARHTGHIIKHILPQDYDHVKQQNVSLRAICKRPLRLLREGSVPQVMVFCSSFHAQGAEKERAVEV